MNGRKGVQKKWGNPKNGKFRGTILLLKKFLPQKKSGKSFLSPKVIIFLPKSNFVCSKITFEDKNDFLSKKIFPRIILFCPKENLFEHNLKALVRVSARVSLRLVAVWTLCGSKGGRDTTSLVRDFGGIQKEEAIVWADILEYHRLGHRGAGS